MKDLRFVVCSFLFGVSVIATGLACGSAGKEVVHAFGGDMKYETQIGGNLRHLASSECEMK